MINKKNIILLLLTINFSCNMSQKSDNSTINALIETNKGKIITELFFKQTPVTVANFISLSEGDNKEVSEQYKGKNYYDGLTFHRVIEDFMIQGGDPSGTGSGSPGYSFKDEIVESLKHDSAGILSMANAGPGTNGSQFFITHKETPWLDGLHTVFGKVISGQEIVDSIEQGDSILSITIERDGKEANKFNASKIFTNHFKEEEKLKKEMPATFKIVGLEGYNSPVGYLQEDGSLKITIKKVMKKENISSSCDQAMIILKGQYLSFLKLIRIKI